MDKEGHKQGNCNFEMIICYMVKQVKNENYRNYFEVVYLPTYLPARPTAVVGT